ncbi:hypothetical protein U9M48_004515 [Paspalum notatum var. saurae]|uniref:Tf2-1-like SH3-like domain-containing protein n=1 Tax=Paspalum notatum var. saurae TaxID=547442 RepID=A0AAQ3SLC4_PASNO
MHSCPRQWVKWISLAEYWYNTTFQSALGLTPFQALYGHPPRQLGSTDPAEVVPDLTDWLKDRALLTSLIQQQLVRAQHKMKFQADTKRSEREFQVEDSVYLKLQPYIQSSVASRAHQKLTFRYYGPFTILQRIGAVAYKLDLPDHIKIHLVVHVSQLKKHIPAQTPVHSDLSSLATDPEHVLLPVHVLQRALVAHGGRTAKRVLIQWGSDSVSFNTWEDEYNLRRQYLQAPAWGQAGFQERGMSQLGKEGYDRTGVSEMHGTTP